MTDREIILALFNPTTKHKDGCLVFDHHIKPSGPCICGFAEVVGNYNAAIREAHKIAEDHYGSSFKAVEIDPIPSALDTLKNIRRLGELACVSVDTLGFPTGGKKPASKDVFQFPRYLLQEIDAIISAK